MKKVRADSAPPRPNRVNINGLFSFQVDLSCMVSTIRWYHEMENGTEVLIKVKFMILVINFNFWS